MKNKKLLINLVKEKPKSLLQVYIDNNTKKNLKRLSKDTGLTVSRIVRFAIDEMPKLVK